MSIKTMILTTCTIILFAGCNRDNTDCETCHSDKNDQALLELTTYTPSQEDSVYLSINDADSYINTDTNLYSMRIDDAPLMDVVRAFTKLSGANIIASPRTLTGRVTANLDGIGWHPALETILDMHNCSLIESPPGSKIYRIDPKVAGAPDPLIVKVIPVKSADEAEEIAAALTKALDYSHLRIAAVPSRKAIIVNGTRADHWLVSEVMEKLNERK